MAQHGPQIRPQVRHVEAAIVGHSCESAHHHASRRQGAGREAFWGDCYMEKTFAG